eukprot:6172944-Pleurochrysis_carterae.AAC.1
MKRLLKRRQAFSALCFFETETINTYLGLTPSSLFGMTHTDSRRKLTSPRAASRELARHSQPELTCLQCLRRVFSMSPPHRDASAARRTQLDSEPRSRIAPLSGREGPATA